MTTPEAPRRRFIAGAVCPQCRALDRLVLEVDADDQTQRRRCVGCGFSETMQASNSTANAVPRARFERSKTQAVESQPVKILDPRRVLGKTGKDR